MAVALAGNVSQQTRAFLSSPKKMLIGGKWSESASGKTFPVYDPASGDVIVQVAEGVTPIERRDRRLLPNRGCEGIVELDQVRRVGK